MTKRKSNIKGEADECEDSTDIVKEEDNKYDELDSDASLPLHKKVKLEKKDPNLSDDIAIHSTSEGEKYVNLGKKKRATVRVFKGNVFVDIREFYGAEGDEKPGKKGVSLNLEQWKALKKSAAAIDSLFSELKK